MSGTGLSAVSRWARPAVFLLWAGLTTGCATHSLNSARHNYYAGRPDKAEEILDSARIPKKDRVLFLMERGTIRQSRGEYEASSRDFIAAFEVLRELETYSLSKGAGSLLVNDTIQDYIGVPFERTLLHALTAQNHMATGDWEHAAVEARRLIESLSDDRRGKYPEEPYSRYMAGLALEMIDDHSNAELQYRIANQHATQVFIDAETGRLHPPPALPLPADTPGDETPPPTPFVENFEPPRERWKAELICFIQLGRSPRGDELAGRGPYFRQSPLYAEIHSGGKNLGRSYTLADTSELARRSHDLQILQKAAKTVGRMAIKEGIAIAVESKNNELAGDLVRLVLIGLLEQPDLRRWETLPRWLQVARVPCPPDLDSFDIVLKNAQGQVVRTIAVTDPIQRRHNTFVSFYRDTPSHVARSTP